MAQRLRPDVVLMDLHMPRKGGVAATREISQSLPHTHVLVLTTLDAEETFFEAIRAGAHPYLLKDAIEEELLETVHRGESRLTPQIARKVMDQFRRMAPLPEGLPIDAVSVRGAAAGSNRSATKAQGAMSERLNDKEENVLQLIAEGKSNKQIANAVFQARGHGQELRQPHHGKTPRQHAHRVGRDIGAPAARRLSRSILDRA